jgi:hypothetical protein
VVYEEQAMEYEPFQGCEDSSSGFLSYDTVQSGSIFDSEKHTPSIVIYLDEGGSVFLRNPNTHLPDTWCHNTEDDNVIFLYTYYH